jgi:T-complex protein 1 subunit zeta
MQSTSSEAQVTQAGQAITINSITCKQLFNLFSPMLGPHGSIKALVSGGQQLNLTKDGNAICRDVQFNHPTSVFITRAASALYDSTGDGVISYILMCTEIFNEAFSYYNEGTSIPTIVNSLQLVLKDITEFLQKNIIPLDDNLLKRLALCSLGTKIRHPSFLCDIVIKALVNISQSKNFDVNMVEIMKMEEGDIRDSIYVDGLVLDHSGRHYAMPDYLENVCVMIANMSLEYEKPEINAEFCYSSALQREELASTEREFISKRASAIADFARELKKEGKSLILVNEKGIDPFSLEILSEAGILALRRAKRRNLERLVNMCGGKVITQVSQINKECLGYCQKVSVKTINENKYTFIEGTPFKGSCTILIRGDKDYERLNKSIRGTLQSLFLAIKYKCCILGGIPLYKNIISHLREKLDSVHESDVVGYNVMIKVYETLIKTLLKNEGSNINERMVKLMREDHSNDESVVENVKVVGNVLNNSVYMAVNLLMCDEIIKAGKPIKQDKIENQ